MPGSVGSMWPISKRTERIFCAAVVQDPAVDDAIIDHDGEIEDKAQGGPVLHMGNTWQFLVETTFAATRVQEYRGSAHAYDRIP